MQSIEGKCRSALLSWAPHAGARGRILECSVGVWNADQCSGILIDVLRGRGREVLYWPRVGEYLDRAHLVTNVVNGIKVEKRMKKDILYLQEKEIV